MGSSLLEIVKATLEPDSFEKIATTIKTQSTTPGVSTIEKVASALDFLADNLNMVERADEVGAALSKVAMDAPVPPTNKGEAVSQLDTNKAGTQGEQPGNKPKPQATTAVDDTGVVEDNEKKKADSATVTVKQASAYSGNSTTHDQTAPVSSGVAGSPTQKSSEQVSAVAPEPSITDGPPAFLSEEEPVADKTKPKDKATKSLASSAAVASTGKKVNDAQVKSQMAGILKEPAVGVHGDSVVKANLGTMKTAAQRVVEKIDTMRAGGQL